MGSSNEFTLHTGCSPLGKLSYGFEGAGTVGARVVSKSMSRDFRFEDAVEMTETSCGNYAISSFSLEDGEEFGFTQSEIQVRTRLTRYILDNGCLHEGDARCPVFSSPAALVEGECTAKYTDPLRVGMFYNRVYDSLSLSLSQPDGCPAATGTFSTAVA